MKNIVEILLEQLDVKYTHTYVTKMYNEHPHKYNMFGLFDILHSYDINAVGVNIENKDYEKLAFPCVLHINGGFVVATEIADKEITYYWNGRKFSLSMETFNTMWTGNAIVIDGDSDASEPNYNDHLREERLGLLKKMLFAATLFVSIFIGLLYNYTHYSFFVLLYMMLDILGLIPCSLLMEKQLHSESKLGNRVCSLFHQKDCNKVLFSEKAKILGFSWSEIGFSFFIAHLFSLIFYPSIVSELSIIGMASILFVVWSIHYQWRVVKQWCVLCLLVQADIILMASSGLIEISKYGLFFNIIPAFAFCTLWLLIVVMLNFYVKHRETAEQCSMNIQKYRALKSNTMVYQTLLAAEKYDETTFSDSEITFGNREARTRITILTNPHCNPCARTHIKVDELIQKCKNKVCIQYIFSSFNEELNESNRFLIAVWQQLGEQKAAEIYSQWYEYGKYHIREFMEKWKNIDIHTHSVEEEMRKHKEWKKRTGYVATPTILVNGYELPEDYDIEDLTMLLD
ncbi:MAG: thioredoxin domain-containing protein [Prevotella sp.]|nr:thioredoxin domain-containing protein [Prevotella sp.]